VLANGLANTFLWAGHGAATLPLRPHRSTNQNHWVADPIDRKPATEKEIYGDLMDNVVL
jgi:hypothetical protein